MFQKMIDVMWPEHELTRLALLLVVLFAACAFLFTVVPFLWTLFRAATVKRKLKRKLKSKLLGTQADPRAIKEHIKSTFGRSVLKGQWDEFHRRWNDAATGEAESRRAPIRIRDVFDDRPIIPSGIRRSLFGGFAGLFVAVGVLGTFVGLMIATTDLADSKVRASSSVVANDSPSPDTNGRQPMAADPRVSNLTRNLGLAFRTSVLGLFFSILFSLALRIVEGRSNRLEDSIDELVQLGFPWLAPAELDAQLAKNQEELIGSLKDSLTDMMTEYQELSSTGFQEIRSGLDRIAGNIGDQQRAALDQVTEGLNETLREGIGQYLGDMREALKSAVDQQESLSERVDKTFEQMEAAAHVNRNVASEVQSAASVLGDAAAALQSCSTDLSPVLENLNVVSTALEQTANSVAETQSAAATTVSEVRLSLEQAESSLHTQREMIESSLGEISSSITSLSEGLADDLVQALGRIDGLMEQSLGRLSGTVGESNETLDRLATPFAALGESVASVNDGIAKAGQQLGVVAKTLEEQLAPISDLGSIVGENTRAQDEVRESTERLVARLESKVDAIVSVGKDIERNAEKEEEVRNAMFKHIREHEQPQVVVQKRNLTTPEGIDKPAAPAAASEGVHRVREEALAETAQRPLAEEREPKQKPGLFGRVKLFMRNGRPNE